MAINAVIAGCFFYAYLKKKQTMAAKAAKK
jgi:hypothetical protein